MKNLIIVASILAVAFLGKKIYDRTMNTIRGVTQFESNSDDRRMADFSKISSGVNADIEWVKGEMFTVHIDAPSDYLADILTEVDGDVLKIKHNKIGFNWGSKKAKIKVTSPTLESISMGGSGAFTNLSPLRASHFEASLGGSGEITLKDVEVETFEAALGGSGTIHADGSALKADVSMGGSGNFLGRNLKADDVEIGLAGSGDIECHAANTLNISLVGSGDIRYLGNPKVTQSKLGSGSIEKLD